jgi:hypothetical protein
MNLLDAAKAQDWVTYDTLYADTNNLEAGGTLTFMLPVLAELITHKQGERARKFFNYYVDMDYDPRDLIKYVGFAAVLANSYAALKMLHAGLKRYPPFVQTDDSKHHLHTVLWVGMDIKIPDRRLLKMLKLAASSGFTFHEGSYLPKTSSDAYPLTLAWITTQIAKEQIEYRDLDTRGGDCLVSKSV